VLFRSQCRKLTAFLIRRGYPPGSVADAMARLRAEKNVSDEQEMEIPESDVPDDGAGD
jgi:hypothetical protein